MWFGWSQSGRECKQTPDFFFKKSIKLHPRVAQLIVVCVHYIAVACFVKFYDHSDCVSTVGNSTQCGFANHNVVKYSAYGLTAL